MRSSMRLDVRGLQILALTAFLWVLLAVLSTQEGDFVDCYPVAVYVGGKFVPTGDWRCFK